MRDPSSKIGTGSIGGENRYGGAPGGGASDNEGVGNQYTHLDEPSVMES